MVWSIKIGKLYRFDSEIVVRDEQGAYIFKSKDIICAFENSHTKDTSIDGKKVKVLLVKEGKVYTIEPQWFDTMREIS